MAAAVNQEALAAYLARALVSWPARIHAYDSYNTCHNKLLLTYIHTLSVMLFNCVTVH
jgi:hypothetical protein